MTYPLLDTIHTSADLRQLAPEQLGTLAEELRAAMLESVSQTGGHFASNLGVVELSIALHYVFETPHDRIVWDVGHQSYPHKMLTGRRARMNSIRQYGGLSGFPSRAESEYDAFGTGHSSTSISATQGMAEASRIQGMTRCCVAVIGDGAMTAGMAFEALQSAGDRPETDLLVVLNDNEMSISPNVGAFHRYLTRLIASRAYQSVRSTGSKLLDRVPSLHELVRRSEEHMKGFFTPSTLFEELGFQYVGPIDGHDLAVLVPTLQNLKAVRGPLLLHVVTHKGQGYERAVGDPVKYHAVSPFTPADGMHSPWAVGAPTYTQIFGDWLCDMARADARLVAITPAMREGSGLVRFSEEFPERYFDVAIAEQHALTFAAGLACEGMKPVVAIYSTFLQRAYDQLIHDIALQNLPVVLAIDRAGLVGADGATHAGAYDLSFLRCIPNLAILAPADENECRQMLYTAFQMQQPVAVRYPRGSGPGVPLAEDFSAIPLGRGMIARHGKQDREATENTRIAILAWGSMLTPAQQAACLLEAGETSIAETDTNVHAQKRATADRKAANQAAESRPTSGQRTGSENVPASRAGAVSVTVANMRWVKPLDQALVLELARSHDLLVTVEENAVMGGAGSAVLEALATFPIEVLPTPPRCLPLGLPDRPVEHGAPAMLLTECGLDAPGIARQIVRHILTPVVGVHSPRTTQAEA